MTEVVDPHFGTTEYTYDALANLVHEPGSGRETTYEENDFNQLVAREDPGKISDYTYDNRGNLVQVMEPPAGGYAELAAYYEYDATNRMTEALPNYAGTAGVEETLYAHADVLGSLTYLTEDDGDGYMAFDYGPWGEIDPSQTLNEFDFVVTASYTGHDYNFVLGVWFAQARLYDAGG